MIRIHLTSVFVDDQAQALRFYTNVLGFVKKNDVPVGEFRWLTVVSPAEPNGVELLLEPSNNPAAQAYKQAIFAQDIPAASFAVDDIQAEYERMLPLGVAFTQPPTPMGPVTVATLNDTCGNLIQIVQKAPPAG